MYQNSALSSVSSISFTGIWIAHTEDIGSSAGRPIARSDRFPIGVVRTPVTTSYMETVQHRQRWSGLGQHLQQQGEDLSQRNLREKHRHEGEQGNDEELQDVLLVEGDDRHLVHGGHRVPEVRNGTEVRHA